MMTDYQYIEHLLNRFFDGETNNEEEQELYRFFCRKDIPEHLIRYKSVFNYFEHTLKNELIEPVTAVKNKRKTKKHKFGIIMAVAACLLFLSILSPWLIRRTETFNPYRGSYIVRNGEKITDIHSIQAELEATVIKALEEEEKIRDLLIDLAAYEKQFEQLEQQIRQKQEDILNHFPEDIKEEFDK